MEQWWLAASTCSLWLQAEIIYSIVYGCKGDNDVQAHNYVISPGTEKAVMLSQCPLRWHIVREMTACPHAGTMSMPAHVEITFTRRRKHYANYKTPEKT